MERRMTSRVKFISEALIEYKGVGYRAEVNNLSLTGALVKIPEKPDIPVNQVLDLTLLISGSTTDTQIRLKCIVVRNDESSASIGVKFDTLDLDAFIFLKNVVAYNTGDSEKVMNEFLDFTKMGKQGYKL